MTTGPSDLPAHARERLAGMKKDHFFTSDLSVNEFLLVKQAGFDPLGLVMGSSIYNIAVAPAQNLGAYEPGRELTPVTQALYHARELAMARLEEEADELGADGVIGVRLEVNLHAWGKSVAEFIAIGTAVKHAGGESFRTAKGKPFQSALSGQDFWTLLRAGYRPVGFVMGNAVYYVRPEALAVPDEGPQRRAQSLHPLPVRRARARDGAPAGRGRGRGRDGHRRRRDRGEAAHLGRAPRPQRGPRRQRGEGLRRDD